VTVTFLAAVSDMMAPPVFSNLVEAADTTVKAANGTLAQKKDNRRLQFKSSDHRPFNAVEGSI
jgi:hypothetical protein